MKSRTSFCKLTPLKKDITRYAPIWALYLVGMLLFLISNGSYIEYADVYAKRNMANLVSAFGIVNLIYAGFCAMMLFGDLFNTKLCYSLHALPQRREHWLLSHLGAGMLFGLVPNILAALFLMTRLGDYWFLALYWLLASQLQFMLFFGIGAVSAMLTGNRFAMVAVYCGFNFVALLVLFTINVLYLPLLTGVVVDTSGFSQLSPVVHLMGFSFFTFKEKTIPDPGSYRGTRTFYEYAGLADGWGYMAILGVVGLAAMAVAWLLYRKRHLESAGDFVAFPKIKGVACVVMTLCVTLCFALFGSLFDSLVVWLAVGLIVGFFGSLMLLERRIKVFRKKTFMAFGLTAAVVILSFVAVGMDWFGIESWTPSADRVQSVTISNFRKSGWLDYDYYYGSQLTETLTEPQDIQQIITAHEDIVDRMGVVYPNTTTHRVTIEYTMKSGRVVTRTYTAPANGTNYEIFNHYFNNEKQLLGYGDQSWSEFVSGVNYLHVNNNEIPAGLHEKLLDALKLDCANGAVSAEGSKEYAHVVEYYTNSGVSRTLFLSSGAKNVIELMKTPEYVLGYENWEEYLSQLNFVGVNGMQMVSQEDRVGLLKAIHADAENGNVYTTALQGYKDVYLEVFIEDNGYYKELLLTNQAENTIDWLKANGYEAVLP